MGSLLRTKRIRIEIGMLRTLLEKIIEKIGGFVKNPWTNLLVGVILFTTSLYEALGSFYDDISQMHLGVHHGIMLFGLLTMLKSIPDIYEGLELMYASEHEVE
jgi:hypothetical protein